MEGILYVEQLESSGTVESRKTVEKDKWLQAWKRDS